MLGAAFESEIREQPLVWEHLAGSVKAAQLAGGLVGDVVLVGSGSSLFVSQLGALAFRRRRLNAHAVAATEVRLDHRAYEHKAVIAVSQSGRSADLLQALDVLRPRHLIALTNDADSPLGVRADLTIDVGAGTERAVPASKSVTSTAALLLWAASLVGGDSTRGSNALKSTAKTIRAWLDSADLDHTIRAAREIADRRAAVVLGSDYGLPIASETALKLKEASYIHAEAFAAGEFRHGSVAMVDSACAVIAFVDDDALPTIERPMREVFASGALRYTIGDSRIGGIERLGPAVDDPYNTLGWLVTAQMIALHAARARHVDADVPRGLTKTLTE